jgi:hypothetical protein
MDRKVTDSLVERQQEAVRRLLESGEFQRSPNLEKILRYLAGEYFAGRSGEVKEFTIATEALGRSVEFDPKKDSIVRVEMHRLRRRLREYAAGKGRSEPLRIDIPEKSYALEFTVVEPAPVARGAETEPEARAAAPEPRGRGGKVWYRLGGLALLLVLGYWAWPEAERREEIRMGPVAAEGPVETGVAPAGEEIRILAGRSGTRYVDRFGAIWQPDGNVRGGEAVAVRREVRAKGLDPNLFAGMREGDFEYEIPLEKRPHELTLYFAETEYGSVNPLGGADTSRLFHVWMNGKTVLENFDVTMNSGDFGVATARVFRDVYPAEDGKLHLRFQSSFSGKAFVNAIEVKPGVAGRMLPVRMVCLPEAYRDAQNRVWQANVHFQGGKQITRPMGAPVERDGDLFRGERFGKFNIAVPVAPGTYTVKLYFWEYWWGPGRPGKGGVGSRKFSVFANFKPLLVDFDIIATAGADQFLVKSFGGIRPNAEGKISLDFVPSVNNAMLNALEILDEGKP